MIASHPSSITSLILVVVIGGCLISSVVAVGGEIRLGAAVVKITPPLGTPLAGYYSVRGSEGVLDDICARAVVLDDGRTQAAMVTCDLIGLSRSVVLEARQIITEKTGIPALNVMISATHTHTAPVVIGDSALDDFTSGGSTLSKDYAAQLPKWIAQAVEDAYKQRVLARVFYGSEDETKLSYIRRFWMKDGTVGWNPGVLNPDIVRPIGNIDPQVNVVYAETAGQQPGGAIENLEADGSRKPVKTDTAPLLTYVNFAMHLDTTGGTRISADYPATLYRLLADYKGPEMVTMFANGACGNINHINVRWAATQSSPAAARRLGTILAADVLKTYADMKQVDEVTLGVRCEVVQVQPAKHTDDELRRAREIAAKKGENTPFYDQVKAYRILDVAPREGQPFEMEVQVFSLGKDIAWVALPGEEFVELGLSVKAASPFRQTNVIELANGWTQYVPHHSAFSEGAYEVISSRYAEGTGEKLVGAAIRLLGELHAAK
jgi:neutral ceramidase